MTFVMHTNMLTYILALGFLGLWFLFARHRKWNIVFGISFFICLLLNFAAIIGMAIGPMKFFYFSKNLLLIGIFGFFFNFFRNNKIALVISILISLWISLKIFSIDLPGKWVPEKIRTLSENGELLIIPADLASLSALRKAIRPYEGELIPAFHPQKKGTALDSFYIIDLPEKWENQQERILKELRQNDLIAYGEFNDIIQVHPEITEPFRPNQIIPLTNDPLVKDQWAFRTLGYDRLYKTMIDHQDQILKKIKVAVLDTGIEGNHEDLEQHLDPQYHTVSDPVGHGTHCAGIIAAETNNRKGVASMAFYPHMIELVPVKVLNSSGMGSQVRVINGMIRAVDEGADVLSMSLGAPSDHPRQKAYAAAVEYALDHNAVVVVSAGNSSSRASNFSPANVPGVICVTATDPDNLPATFSNYLDSEISYGIAAPGVRILSTFRNGEYKTLSGTSMAAPFVSATAALLKAFDPEISTAEIYELLHKTALSLEKEEKSGRLLQPEAALQKLMSEKVGTDH